MGNVVVLLTLYTYAANANTQLGVTCFWRLDHSRLGKALCGTCRIEQGLTSHQTHYGSYRGRVVMGQMTQPTVSKHWSKIGP